MDEYIECLKLPLPFDATLVFSASFSSVIEFRDGLSGAASLSYVYYGSYSAFGASSKFSYGFVSMVPPAGFLHGLGQALGIATLAYVAAFLTACL